MTAGSIFRALAGRRSDWVTKPVVDLSPRGILGPLLIAATVAVSWIPFAGMPVDSRSDPLGLYLGMVSLLLMAWSFVLALRLGYVESLFGGLDRGYAWHRWIGVIAIVLMWLHIQQPNNLQGIFGASEVIAELGTNFGGFAESVFYILIALSILRWMPYRWWRLTHKLLGIPYLFAAFHVFTAEKPFANLSPWGVWFTAIMILGAIAWIARVVVRDVLRPGIPYTVSEVGRFPTVTEVTLRPASGKKLQRRLGQFAFVKVQVPGLAEPHAFSIASAPGEDHLRFLIRVRGDWTEEASSAISPGQLVIVEGPYGRLRLFPRTKRTTVWFAGGLGITPFLSAIAERRDSGNPAPKLFYSVSNTESAMALSELRSAHDLGLIELHVHVSADGNRLTREKLEAVFGPGGLAGAHIVLCGPGEYAADVKKWTSRLGARHIEHESFDIRSGIGPDMSTTRLTDTPTMRWADRLRHSSLWLTTTREK